MTSTTAPLAPLEPQPAPYYSYQSTEEVPDVTTDADGTQQPRENIDDGCGMCTSIDEEERRKFECAVCFEFMDTPVGCGSCRTRFCRLCLERIAKQGGSSPLCSHCRAPFTLESIKVDDELQEDINNSTETTTCPFRGCGKQVSINALKLHEAQCGHIHMKCKFSEWGCEWIGKRMDLENHDKNECEFRNEMGRLVDAIRLKTLNQAEEIARLQSTRVNQAVNLHTRRMLMIRGRNAGNVFDVLAMTYEACCFPGRFAATKDMWGNMVSQDHPRSMALNILLTLPPIIMISKCTFWAFFDLSNTFTPQQIYDAGLIGVLIHFHQVIVPTCATMFAVIVMISDEANATQWSVMPLPQGEGYPLPRDAVAVSFFMALFFFGEYWEYWPGIMLHIVTFASTVSFASCVARILEKVSGSEEKDTLKKSRMWSTMVFALRYSCLFQICRPYAAVKGIILVRLAQHAGLKHLKLKFTFTVEETECFLAVIHPGIVVALGAMLTVSDYMAITNWQNQDFWMQHWSEALGGWLFGAFVLIFFNVFTDVLYHCGSQSGEQIYDEGENMRNLSNERIQSYNALPSQRPSITGIFTITLTVFYLIFLMCV